MVVGTQHDHDPVEAALALVEVVGAVGGEVGPLAVGLDEDPVLVVAERRRPQPGRAVVLVDVPGRSQPRQGRVELALVVQLLLVEVDVEGDAEVGQRLPDLLEHQVQAVAAEDGQRGVVVEAQDVGVAGDNGFGDLADVGAAVAAFRRGLALWLQRTTTARSGRSARRRR